MKKELILSRLSTNAIYIYCYLSVCDEIDLDYLYEYKSIREADFINSVKELEMNRWIDIVGVSYYNLPSYTIHKKQLKSSKKKELKKVYGFYKNVLLTDSEYNDLLEKYKTLLKPMIEKLSTSIQSYGYKYKSHYLVFGKWVYDAVLKENKFDNNVEKIDF